MDASNLLKPALARGELHCIGATTLDEYRKHVEKDAALERRFQPVFVGEPTVEDTISILRGLKEKYELHHGVRITDGAIVAAATLSQPLHHRPLPARQGDRPDGRGGRAAAHGGRVQARGDRRARPPHHPAQDRARGAEEGERPGLAGPARSKLEAELAELEQQSAELTAAVAGREGASSPSAQKLKEQLDAARASSSSRRSAAATGAAPASSTYGAHPRAREAARRRPRRAEQAAHARRGGRPTEDIAAVVVALDRHPGRQDAGGRAREAAADGGEPAARA